MPERKVRDGSKYSKREWKTKGDELNLTAKYFYIKRLYGKNTKMFIKIDMKSITN